MVIGKLKYLIGPASGHHPTLSTSVPCVHMVGAELGSVVSDGGSDPQPRKKGEKLHV
ncbi:hypothetical protein C2845_PM01G44940 [Panicum miliaceum]|uniref:Uncharacterized protein n=1 Tax=Panicum miliaceum TaxID=4540 RepID=A0A3L6TSF9_PANMI|nr:hypothetical protein C2845_PM01G44940 [Panicum miliaceum]